MQKINCTSCKSRKKARLNWVASRHGKKWLKEYMKEYRQRPEAKAKTHEYYLRKKIKEYELENSI